MYLVIYVSTATRRLSDDDLNAILEQSREWNSSVDITGMLLYKGGNIMQFLEGEKEEVISLLNKIRVDPRHHGLIVLVQEEHQDREFDQWSMAYKHLEGPLEVPGYGEHFDLPVSSEKFLTNPTKTLELLLAFRKSLASTLAV
jgi:hypothetical protein